MISNKEVTTEEPRPVARKEPAVEIPSAPPPERTLPKATPKPVSAKSWSDDETSELANTQIISKLSEEDEDKAAEAVLSLSTGGSEPGAQRAGPSRGSPSPAPKSAPKKNDDAELLAELKSVINKKFDELMK